MAVKMEGSNSGTNNVELSSNEITKKDRNIKEGLTGVAGSGTRAARINVTSRKPMSRGLVIAFGIAVWYTSVVFKTSEQCAALLFMTIVDGEQPSSAVAFRVQGVHDAFSVSSPPVEL